jgi:hypothetical protein
MYQEREQQKLIQMSMNSNNKRRNPKQKLNYLPELKSSARCTPYGQELFPSTNGSPSYRTNRVDKVNYDLMKSYDYVNSRKKRDNSRSKA